MMLRRMVPRALTRSPKEGPHSDRESSPRRSGFSENFTLDADVPHRSPSRAVKNAASEFIANLGDHPRLASFRSPPRKPRRSHAQPELDCRRREELSFVKSCDTYDAALWFIIDAAWLQKWHSFVKGGPLPGRIPNETLVHSDMRPRSGKQPIVHYRGVNSRIWEYFVMLYGGGPALPRRTLNLYAPRLDSTRQSRSSSQRSVSSGRRRHSPGPFCADQGEAESNVVSLRRASLARNHSNSKDSTCSDGASSAGSGSSNDSSYSVFVKHEDARVVRQPGDGSCLFHSLSCCLADGSDARSLRKEIVDYITSNPKTAIASLNLEDWVMFDCGETVETYAAQLSEGAWGGAIEIEVFVRLKELSVHVYEKSHRGYKRICTFGTDEMAGTVNLLYQGRKHYDVLVDPSQM